jgi:DNA polymerase III sliding clamp (beta) subunit (PCNA family)
MIIKKSELQEALKIVEAGLADKEIAYLEQAKSFAFIGNRIVTYNDEVNISHPVQGWENTDGAIQAEKLYQLLSKLKAEELEIFVNKKNELIIKAGKAKAGFTLQKEVKIPANFDIEFDWKPLPEYFVAAVSFVRKSASNDPEESKLQCLHLNSEGYIEASDVHRIARYDFKKELDIPTFLLPVKSAVEVIKISPTEISVSEGWAHFRNEADTIFSCRIINEEFPKTDPHLMIEGDRLVFPEALLEVIDRAMIVAERKSFFDEKIIISMKDKVVKVRSEANNGWFEEDVETESKSEPVTFTVFPSLFKDILSETSACVIDKQRTKLLFEGDNWKYMTVLITE